MVDSFNSIDKAEIHALVYDKSTVIAAKTGFDSCK